MAIKGKVQSLVGKRFGRLVVLEKYEQREVKGSGRTRRKTFWLCMCVCENEKWISRDCLISGNTTSCGCYSKEIRSRPFGEAAKRKLYCRYRQDAKKRGIDFYISEKEFLSIVAESCTYCGRDKVSYYQPKRCNGGFNYTGIDRINSSCGYVLGNCQPCCVDCNRAKWELSHEDFLEQIEMRYKWVTQNLVAT